MGNPCHSTFLRFKLAGGPITVCNTAMGASPNTSRRQSVFNKSRSRDGHFFFVIELNTSPRALSVITVSFNNDSVVKFVDSFRHWITVDEEPVQSKAEIKC